LLCKMGEGPKFKNNSGHAREDAGEGVRAWI
jgi:hypothetical protein